MLRSKWPPRRRKTPKTPVKAIAYALESKLGLFTELPRGDLLGNSGGNASRMPQQPSQEALSPQPDMAQRPVAHHPRQRVEGHALRVRARPAEHGDDLTATALPRAPAVVLSTQVEEYLGLLLVTEDRQLRSECSDPLSRPGGSHVSIFPRPLFLASEARACRLPAREGLARQALLTK